jgi:type IV pilus assembly protein PilX
MAIHVRQLTQENRTMRCHSHTVTPGSERGVVLPIALIMLVIISFAGLLAARNSATFEQFSNNMRTNQVARVAAEDALRQCERIARSTVEGSAAFAADVGKIEDTNVISADTEAAISAGIWNTRSNWASGAANLITVTPSYTGSVAQTSAQLRNAPTCIVQAMVNDRFLITSRGLSNDAVVDANGLLTAGSEVWLQSILTPLVPTLCPNNGVC